MDGEGENEAFNLKENTRMDDDRTVELVVKIPVTAWGRIMLEELAYMSAEEAVIRETPNISRCFLEKNDNDEFYIQTEGTDYFLRSIHKTPLFFHLWALSRKHGGNALFLSWFSSEDDPSSGAGSVSEHTFLFFFLFFFVLWMSLFSASLIWFVRIETRRIQLTGDVAL